VGGRGQGTVERRKDPLGPQATDSRPRAEGDVDGVRAGVRRAGTVRDARAPTRRGLPPGAGPAAAPGGRCGERELQTPRHLDRTILAR